MVIFAIFPQKRVAAFLVLIGKRNFKGGGKNCAGIAVKK